MAEKTARCETLYIVGYFALLLLSGLLLHKQPALSGLLLHKQPA